MVSLAKKLQIPITDAPQLAVLDGYCACPPTGLCSDEPNLDMELAGFRLVNGRYEQITADRQGRLISAELGLGMGIYECQLRWYTLDGMLIPLPEEAERQAKERLEAFLRSQGIDPSQIAD